MDFFQEYWCGLFPFYEEDSACSLYFAPCLEARSFYSSIKEGMLTPNVQFVNHVLKTQAEMIYSQSQHGNRFTHLYENFLVITVCKCCVDEDPALPTKVRWVYSRGTVCGNTGVIDKALCTIILEQYQPWHIPEVDKRSNNVHGATKGCSGSRYIRLFQVSPKLL